VFELVWCDSSIDSCGYDRGVNTNAVGTSDVGFELVTDHHGMICTGTNHSSGEDR
jgi:hypothetical protein